MYTLSNIIISPQGGKSRSTSTSMLGHSRNLSDSGVHRMQENMETPQVKWPGHKRQLSDSFAMAPSGGDTRADRYGYVGDRLACCNYQWAIITVA